MLVGALGVRANITREHELVDVEDKHESTDSGDKAGGHEGLSLLVALKHKHGDNKGENERHNYVRVGRGAVPLVILVLVLKVLLVRGPADGNESKANATTCEPKHHLFR